MLTNLAHRGWDISKVSTLHRRNIPLAWVNTNPRPLNHLLVRQRHRLFAHMGEIDEARESIVKCIHASEIELVVYATGGGAQVRIQIRCCTIRVLTLVGFLYSWVPGYCVFLVRQRQCLILGFHTVETVYESL